MSRRATSAAYRADRGRNCGTCEFWQPEVGGSPRPAADDTGTCRRYAPTMPAGFPATARSDWCGDYAMHEAAADLMEVWDG